MNQNETVLVHALHPEEGTPLIACDTTLLISNYLLFVVLVLEVSDNQE